MIFFLSCKSPSGKQDVSGRVILTAIEKRQSRGLKMAFESATVKLKHETLDDYLNQSSITENIDSTTNAIVTKPENRPFRWPSFQFSILLVQPQFVVLFAIPSMMFLLLVPKWHNWCVEVVKRYSCAFVGPQVYIVRVVIHQFGLGRKSSSTCQLWKLQNATDVPVWCTICEMCRLPVHYFYCDCQFITSVCYI